VSPDFLVRNTGPDFIHVTYRTIRLGAKVIDVNG
jgi:hypothetical protein